MLKFFLFDKSVLSRADTAAVTDEKLSGLYGIRGENVLILPRGEECKSFFWLERICSFLLEKNISKNGTLAAIGGGSVGDVGGLAAAVYKRGINFINYPTTLLAMTDSAIGGKTAIDLCGVKNAVGAYYSGDTIIDINFLKTLDDNQVRSAWGEITKYRFLSEQIDKTAGGTLEKGLLYTPELIELCARYKYGLTTGSPVDGRARRTLNMGHTFGHAFEMVLPLSHGEAVWNGLYYETLLARKLFNFDEKFIKKRLGRISGVMKIQGFPDIRKLLPLLRQDKKNTADKICFVLSKAGYETQEIYLTEKELLELLPL